MDETVLKIAMAAFMHDIGKFADKTVMGISNEYKNNHADLYQPYYQGRHTHSHAVHTAAFIENHGDYLPVELNRSWGNGDAFINLAAGHHRPETPYQWIIALADRISSGWDRDTFDDKYNYQVSWKDYQKTRLIPLFEQLSPNDPHQEADPDRYLYRYPLKPLSPEDIFPTLKEETEARGLDAAVEEYRDLFQKFTTDLKTLCHRQENLELWFEHFDSLMRLYTSAIPAARAGKVIPDVSLYDHSRATAALATAIYRYHFDHNDLTVGAIRDYDNLKFLIVKGDLYGIQKFIFNEQGDTRKLRSKILRGRSFAISLTAELTADFICRETGLPFSSVLMNAGGKFVLIAPNTEDIKEQITQVERRINDWLVQVSYGENSVGIAWLEASANDFVQNKFIKLWERLHERIEWKKCSRIDLDKHSGVVQGYLDRVDRQLRHPLCPLCGKRPSDRKTENDPYLGEIKSACRICRDHVFLGTKLVKENRLAITRPEADIHGQENRLLEPIFGLYQAGFLDGKLLDLARSGQLLRFWDLSNNPRGEKPQEISTRFINGYVPVYREVDLADECILAGEKSPARKLEMIDQIQTGEPKTLSHIAAKARNLGDVPGAYQGTAALGVLKADVDHLGLLMACGLPAERFTLSRLATLSRQLDYYFSLYLPHLLKENTDFSNTYTVFAGGDDLFLIGPWNKTIDLVRHLNRSFADYVCRNPEIHLSAAVTLHKPNTPLDFLGETVDIALEKAKQKGRNRINLFTETATWEEEKSLQEIKSILAEWISKGYINNALLYRFNRLMEMAEWEKRVTAGEAVYLEDMAAIKWRSQLVYTVERNAAPHLRGEDRKKILNEMLSKLSDWLSQFGGKLKIPVWELLYNQR
jgi:CRISPR-associated protein Csm1